MPARTKAFLALTVVSAIWGIASVVIKYTVQFIPPFSFLTIRFVIASIILHFFVKKIHKSVGLWRTGKFKDLNKEDIKLFLAGVIGSSINLVLVFYAFKYTSSIEGTLILAAAPIFTIIGGFYFLKEKVTKKEFIGISITLVGFSLIVFKPLLEQSINFSQDLLGNLIMIGAVFSWVAYVLVSKNIFNNKRSNHSPTFITFVTFFSGAITLFPFGIYEILTTQIDFIKAIPGILYMTILSTVVAYTLFEYGVQKIEAGEAELFHYLQPVFTIPVAMIFLGEAFSMLYLIGGLIILIGLYIAERRIRIIRKKIR